MKHSIFRYILILMAVLVLSNCSDHTVEVNPTKDLMMIKDGFALGSGAKVEIWAKEDLFAGYNKIYIALYDSVSKKRITDAHIHLNPIMTMMGMGGMMHGCPVENPAELAVNSLFPSSLTFIMPTSAMGTWDLEMEVHNHLNNKEGVAAFDITVANPASPRIKSFVTVATDKIFVAYYFPDKMKVGVNNFEVIVYKMAGPYEFLPVTDYSFVLTPEMPSMGHGSPNNINPVYSADGHYVGKVNFTMTGGWRLNLDISQNGTAIQTLYFDVEL